jgi:hypothetical protein
LKDPVCLICNKNQNYLNYFEKDNSKWEKDIVYLIKSKITDYNFLPPNFQDYLLISPNQTKIICLVFNSENFGLNKNGNVKFQHLCHLYLPIDFVRSDIIHSRIRDNLITFRRGFSESLYDAECHHIQTKEWICVSCFTEIDPRYQEMHKFFTKMFLLHLFI